MHIRRFDDDTSREVRYLYYLKVVANLLNQAYYEGLLWKFIKIVLPSAPSHYISPIDRRIVKFSFQPCYVPTLLV